MADEKVGIESLKKVVSFGVELAQQVDVATADGWQWSDSFGFVKEIAQVPGLIKSGKDIAAELKDLSKEERTELDTYIQEKFDIANDKVEGIIEDALSVLLGLVSLIDRVAKKD